MNLFFFEITLRNKMFVDGICGISGLVTFRLIDIVPVSFMGQTIFDRDFVDLVGEHTVPKFLRFGISAALRWSVRCVNEIRRRRNGG